MFEKEPYSRETRMELDSAMTASMRAKITYLAMGFVDSAVFVSKHLPLFQRKHLSLMQFRMMMIRDGFYELDHFEMIYNKEMIITGEELKHLYSLEKKRDERRIKREAELAELRRLEEKKREEDERKLREKEEAAARLEAEKEIALQLEKQRVEERIKREACEAKEQKKKDFAEQLHSLMANVVEEREALLLCDTSVGLNESDNTNGEAMLISAEMKITDFELLVDCTETVAGNDAECVNEKHYDASGEVGVCHMVIQSDKGDVKQRGRYIGNATDTNLLYDMFSAVVTGNETFSEYSDGNCTHAIVLQMHDVVTATTGFLLCAENRYYVVTVNQFNGCTIEFYDVADHALVAFSSAMRRRGTTDAFLESNPFLMAMRDTEAIYSDYLQHHCYIRTIDLHYATLRAKPGQCILFVRFCGDSLSEADSITVESHLPDDHVLGANYDGPRCKCVVHTYSMDEKTALVEGETEAGT